MIMSGYDLGKIK